MVDKIENFITFAAVNNDSGYPEMKRKQQFIQLNYLVKLSLDEKSNIFGLPVGLANVFICPNTRTKGAEYN